MSKENYDLNLKPDKARSSGLEEFVQKAEALGVDTVAFNPKYEDIEDSEGWKREVSDLNSDLDVLSGVEIQADGVKEMKDKISAVREEFPVVCVSGGDDEINRAAADDPRVDFISHPGEGRKDCGIDQVIAKKASENNVALEANFRLILENKGKYRTYQLKKLGRYIQFKEKFDTPIITNSGAEEAVQMRAPRDMAAVLQSLGLEKGEALKTVEEVPSRIVERFRERQEDGFVRSGIEKEVVDDES